MVSIMAALGTRERLDLILPCGSRGKGHTDRHWANLTSHSRGTWGVRSVNDSQGRDVCADALKGKYPGTSEHQAPVFFTSDLYPRGV